MICLTCKTPNINEARFCLSCGEALPNPNITPHLNAAFLGVVNASGVDALDDEITRVAPALIHDASNIPRNDRDDPMLGRTIENKYRLIAKLGRGGMGSVYRAERPLIGDQVAVKILHAEHVAQPQSFERFRREAQAAARLKHPNAVSIYDFGVTSDGLVYLVMELVEGHSLRQIIKQQGPLTPTATAEIITQVCSALEEAHRQQIVHRDLKPDNIIVNAGINGLRTKVLDFGIAKLRDLTAGNLTQTGSVMGTPHYMSPEQCLGEELDHRSDVYSLGIVLYEMLTGLVPFNSPISTAVVVQHVNQKPPSLRAINVSISEDLERVVLHALEKKREARPQTATLLSTELNAAVRPPANLSPEPALPPSTPGQPAGPVMAPTMVMRTPLSGNPLVIPSATTHGGLDAATNQIPVKRSAAKRILLFTAPLAFLIATAAVYLAFFSFSAKQAVIDEIRKGSLVKPEGSSAYDLYGKYKQKDLTSKDKEEITNEVAPKIEKRGDEIFNGLKQDQAESEDQWAEAIRLYSWLNELRPNKTTESKVHFSQASLAFSRKDFNAALTSYQRAAQLQPDALTLNRLGRVYLNLKDKGSAREYYRQATVAEPSWVSPWINLGAICLDMNDPYSAEPALRQAISIDSQKASAHNLLGQALEKQVRLCEALQEYSSALDLATRNPTNTVNSDMVRKRIAALNARYVCGD
ncbi:MAG TPA: protein kinase [Pyrinomonadaceae bacterium]|nr:protein kinase [Pyrinomonadaceae bacterium]